QSNGLIRAGGFLEDEMITSAAKKLVGNAEMTVSPLGKFVCVVEIVVSTMDIIASCMRIHSGNDRIRSSNDHVQTINKHDAFGNDRLPLGHPYLQNGDNRLGLANYRFRYRNSYFPRAVWNSLIRWGLMIAGNNRLCCGNDYLHLGRDYL